MKANNPVVRIPIWLEERAKKAIEKCEKLYEKDGVSAVTDYANKIGAAYRFCEPCDAEMPVVKTPTICVCLVCGQ